MGDTTPTPYEAAAVTTFRQLRRAVDDLRTAAVTAEAHAYRVQRSIETGQLDDLLGNDAFDMFRPAEHVQRIADATAVLRALGCPEWLLCQALQDHTRTADVLTDELVQARAVTV